MSVRVKIDLSSGLIELEGDKDFVGPHLDKLLPMIEAAGFGGFQRQDDYLEQPSDTGDAADETVPDSGKKKRRVPKRPPSGASCRDRILILKADGFFKGHKSPTEIVGGLAKKGWTYKANQVSAALTSMFNSGEIQRTKAEQGTGFAYFWDRSET